MIGQTLWQHLDGYFTAQVGVLSSIHFPHTALADLLDDFVVRECLANHFSCRWGRGVSVPRTS